MELYTGFYNKRFKRVIGKLSKNGKVLEDAFAVISMPINNQMIPMLSHLDSVAFALDKLNNRIICNVNVKDLEDLRPLSDFSQSNVKHLEMQYIEATTSLYVAEELPNGNNFKL